MPKKRFGAEQIVTLLRQIEVSMAQGKATPVACRDAGISQQATRRTAQWRNLLQLEGGSGSHRAMAKALQHDQATLFARIPTTGATDDEPVPDTARSDRANAIVSPSRWYRKSVRPTPAIESRMLPNNFDSFSSDVRSPTIIAPPRSCR